MTNWACQKGGNRCVAYACLNALRWLGKYQDNTAAHLRKIEKLLKVDRVHGATWGELTKPFIKLAKSIGGKAVCRRNTNTREIIKAVKAGKIVAISSYYPKDNCYHLSLVIGLSKTNKSFIMVNFWADHRKNPLATIRVKTITKLRSSSTFLEKHERRAIIVSRT